VTTLEPGRKVRIVELPAASTTFTAEPRLEFPVKSGLVLQFDYDDHGLRYRSALRFNGVQAHRHRAEGVCTAWHVQDAYDTLVEVQPSTWCDELAALSRERGYDPGNLHHYLLFIDSAGCYEVVAKSWEIRPPERL
jgi:hypothetical protein